MSPSRSGRIYRMWMDNDCFKATPDPDKKPFSIVCRRRTSPAPLHMGHAMDATLQDILTRFKRMQGWRGAVAPRHRPRGHRHADQGRGGAAQEA